MQLFPERTRRDSKTSLALHDFNHLWSVVWSCTTRSITEEARTLHHLSSLRKLFCTEARKKKREMRRRRGGRKDRFICGQSGLSVLHRELEEWCKTMAIFIFIFTTDRNKVLCFLFCFLLFLTSIWLCHAKQFLNKHQHYYYYCAYISSWLSCCNRLMINRIQGSAARDEEMNMTSSRILIGCFTSKHRTPWAASSRRRVQITRSFTEEIRNAWKYRLGGRLLTQKMTFALRVAAIDREETVTPSLPPSHHGARVLVAPLRL